LIHNSGIVTGIGIERPLTKDAEKCWMYFPETPPRFYRLTHFSKYSANNVPDGDVSRFASYMCEISILIQTGRFDPEDRKRIVSRFAIAQEYFYPIPTIGLKESLLVIHPLLESLGIFSRGRFGAWMYEIGNMDHSVMQGMEVVNRILGLGPEKVFRLD